MFPPPTPAQQEQAAFCEYVYSTRSFLVNMPPGVFGVATLDKETRKLHQSQVVVAMDLLITSIRYPDQRLSTAMPEVKNGYLCPRS